MEPKETKSNKRRHHNFSEYELLVLERFYKLQPNLTPSTLQTLRMQLNVPDSDIKKWYEEKTMRSKRSKLSFDMSEN